MRYIYEKEMITKGYGEDVAQLTHHMFIVRHAIRKPNVNILFSLGNSRKAKRIFVASHSIL